MKIDFYAAVQTISLAIFDYAYVAAYLLSSMGERYKKKNNKNYRLSYLGYGFPMINVYLSAVTLPAALFSMVAWVSILF